LPHHSSPRLPPIGDARDELVVLVVEVEGRLSAIAAEHVEEMMRPLPVEPLPEAPPYVRGISLIRGRATPVLSLSRLIATPHETVYESRFLLLRSEAKPVALAVERVVGLRKLARSELSPLPPLWETPREEWIRALGALEGRVLMLLESARVLAAASPLAAATDRGAP